MELKDQVCSLELAKKLKNLGVKQESLFFWIKAVYLKGNEEWQLWSKWEIDNEGEDFGILEEQQDYCAAFTVAELGEMLPPHAVTSKYKAGKWWCENKPCSAMCAGHDTEADARAKMLIYLLENQLITL